eukprot:TRINITY_DN8457_c0_g1_i1.p1 TRINITY_DN8457_c0_g1~~TRINITY_DN8457_c0_g1_i1.p1  ORF type:complete len:100 (-),score=35.68 TRINITY_DN8457_c0_g1_i1:47-346(-)
MCIRDSAFGMVLEAVVDLVLSEEIILRQVFGLGALPAPTHSSDNNRHTTASPSSTTTPVSYTHLRAHETPEHLVCRLLLEKKKKKTDRATYTLAPDKVV